jgi:ribonuclease BN (tRNA processing enzyme)
MNLSDQQIRLQCVGSGDAFGSGGRLNSCYHLDIGAEQLLLDCGCSSLIGLQRCGLKTGDIATVVVSHLHGDHFGGIPFLLLEGKYASQRRSPLTLIGPPGLQQQVEAALDALYPGVLADGFDFPLHYVALQPQQVYTGEYFSLEAWPVRHGKSEHVYGFRVETAGKVISYTGDSEWTENIVNLARQSDLLIAECFAYDQPIPSHLDYQTLMSNRDRLDCKRLVITHMGLDMLRMLDQVELEALNDGDVLEI